MSRRVTSRLVRTGAQALTYGTAGEYEMTPFDGEPNIWAHVERHGLWARWRLTTDRQGETDVLADGRALRRQKAFLRAIAASQRPRIVYAAKRAAERGRAAR